MSSVRVCVRVRPLNGIEKSQNCGVVVETNVNSQVTVRNPENERAKTFTFDEVVSICLKMIYLNVRRLSNPCVSTFIY
jgi:hypothetical protein